MVVWFHPLICFNIEGYYTWNDHCASDIFVVINMFVAVTALSNEAVVVCVLCLLGLPLLHKDSDLRILPSTDSHSDLAFDESSLSRSHVPSPVQQDRSSETYARGQACHRSPLLQPSDTEAQPLQRDCCMSVDDADACHCEF